jgi:hypothetical protein
MKKVFLVALALTAGIAVISSCKKDKKKGCMDPVSLKYDDEAEEDDYTCTYGGLGGNTTVVAKPEHHHNAITGKPGYVDSAFVKFNAQNSPGSNASAYDLVLAGEVGEDHVHVEGLKPGKYYIMMTGWDSTAVETGHPNGQRVFGGIPFILTQESGEVDVPVPVVE